jgi:protein involved in sex pheromone biosynthesis
MEISNIYALIWLGLKIVYLYYLPIEISIYKSNKTTSIVNGSSITSQEAQSGNLARISVLMYIIVQICHKIYILK